MQKVSRVFITQIPHRKDPATDAFVPSVNVTPAAEHGELIIMMPPRTSFHATEDLTQQLREHLKTYDFDAGDCIVALGDPSVLGVAFALLGSMFSRFTILKWDRNLGRYLPVLIRV